MTDSLDGSGHLREDSGTRSEQDSHINHNSIQTRKLNQGSKTNVNYSTLFDGQKTETSLFKSMLPKMHNKRLIT